MLFKKKKINAKLCRKYLTYSVAAGVLILTASALVLNIKVGTSDNDDFKVSTIYTPQAYGATNSIFDNEDESIVLSFQYDNESYLSALEKESTDEAAAKSAPSEQTGSVKEAESKTSKETEKEPEETKADVIEYKNIEKTEEIEYKVEYIDSKTIPKGKESVTQKGKNGELTYYIKQKFVNGELVNEETVDKKVTEKAVNKVIERGVGGTFTAPDGTDYEYSYYLDVVATAYGDGTGDDPDGPGHAATGVMVELGVIAVDPKVIPLSSTVYVIGDYGDYGVCHAEDVGGNIKGNRIDIYLGPDEDVIRQFGRRNMRVYVM